MREQHELELDDERVRWTRDRRTDLYIRINTVLKEWQKTFSDWHLTHIKNASDTEKITAQAAKLKAVEDEQDALTVKIQQQPGVSFATELANLTARSHQLDRQSEKLTTESEQAKADLTALTAQLNDLTNSVYAQWWALEVLGSKKVRSLADIVLGEITEVANAFRETGKPREFDYGNWDQLNSAMREELQILD